MCSAGGIVRRRRPWKRAATAATYFLYLIILVEIASRAFVAMRYDTSFWKPRDYVYHFYPELKIAEEGLDQSSPDAFRVLILGGSVISHFYSRIDSLLYVRLSEQTDRRVETYNMAIKAHTSLDSYYKYRHLENHRFDLVVLYHGINELRTNNCPGDMYCRDYSHYAWYHELNTLMAHREMSIATFPAIAHLLFHKTQATIGSLAYLPVHSPPEEWLRYGVEIRSAEPLRRHMEGIIDMSVERGEKVLLMSFAYYIPDNYCPDKFEQKMLDYDDHLHPVELWGSPVCVRRGLDTHNAVLRDLAKQRPSVCFVDQDVLLERGREHFRDVCHLTRHGDVEFVDNAFEQLRGYLWSAR